MSPNQVLASQEELLDFCVRSVYQRLGRSAQTLLAVLYSLERDTTFDELAVLTDASVDELRRGVQALFASSLAALEPDNDNQLISRVRLTEVAQAFRRRVNPPSNEDVEAILARERTLRQSEEERRREEESRLLAPNVVRVSSNHEQPVAYLLRLALMASKKRELENAAHYLNRARDLNPEYWEVDRVEAFMLSSAGRVEQATPLYRSALRKADAEGRAVVSYFLAGHLARRVRDLNEALKYARSAHAYFRSADTALLLGNILIWSNEFISGQEYLETGLETARGKNRLIVLTALVDSWQRWAEHVLEHDHDATGAFQKANAGFSVGSQEMRRGTFDVKLADSVLECCVVAITSSTTGSMIPTSYERPLKEMMQAISSQQLVFEKTNAWRFFPSKLKRLQRFAQSTATTRRLCEKILEREGLEASTEAAGEEQLGWVHTWKGTFGFIQQEHGPQRYFFPASAVENLTQRAGDIDLAGKAVRFTVQDDERGARAGWVLLVER